MVLPWQIAGPVLFKEQSEKKKEQRVIFYIPSPAFSEKRVSNVLIVGLSHSPIDNEEVLEIPKVVD